MNIPVVLPNVHVDVDHEGSLAVAVDGAPYEHRTGLRREDLQPLLRELADKLAAPMRVEVIEADGSTYCDIVTPPEAVHADPIKEPPAGTSRLPNVRALGFRPGEPIALAYIVLTEEADAHGDAVMHLPPAVLAAQHKALVLVGLDSQVARLPDGFGAS